MCLKKENSPTSQEVGERFPFYPNRRPLLAAVGEGVRQDDLDESIKNYFELEWDLNPHSCSHGNSSFALEDPTKIKWESQVARISERGMEPSLSVFPPSVPPTIKKDIVDT